MNDSMSPPRRSPVSVIIPAYNAELYLGATIHSVLRQTAPISEIIVVDDGSIDATRNIVQAFAGRVDYIPQVNAGVSAARNMGLQRASSDWVMFLDADDLLPATAVEALLLKAPREANSVVYGDQEVIDENGAVRGFQRAAKCTGKPPAAARASFEEAPFAPGAAIVDRKLALSVGGFDVRFQTCADRHFWIRCGLLSRFYYAQSIVYQYRRHGQAMSRDRVANAREGVLVQIDCLRFAMERGVESFDKAVTAEYLLSARLWRLLLTRRFESFAAIDALASELQIDGPAVSAARKLSASVPREGGELQGEDLLLRGLGIYQWFTSNRLSLNLSPRESEAAQMAFASFAVDCQTTASCRGLAPFLKTRKTLRRYGLAPAGVGYAAWMRALSRPLASGGA